MIYSNVSVAILLMRTYKYANLTKRRHPRANVIFFDTISSVIIDTELWRFGARAYRFIAALSFFSHYPINISQDYDMSEKIRYLTCL